LLFPWLRCPCYHNGREETPNDRERDAAGVCSGCDSECTQP
jgi:hypothetical protein